MKPFNLFEICDNISEDIINIDIRFKKVETTIPEDIQVSSINKLSTKEKNITLEVHFISKDIFEVDGAMFVLFNMYDSGGEMRALLVNNISKDFSNFVKDIKLPFKYRINGNVSTIKDDADLDELEIPFIDRLKNTRVFLIRALECIEGSEEELEEAKKHMNYLKNSRLGRELVPRARDEINNIFNSLEVIRESVIVELKTEKGRDNFPSLQHLHFIFCYDFDREKYLLDMHQFYHLFMCPLIKDKLVRISNYESSDDKPLPFDEFEYIGE